jgi:hypothetical protein
MDSHEIQQARLVFHLWQHSIGSYFKGLRLFCPHMAAFQNEVPKQHTPVPPTSLL